MAEQKQIGIYRVIKTLGSGGMGMVYLVEDMEAGGQYALKFLSPSVSPSEREVRRFRREFMTMSRLRHLNIVKVFDSGIYEDSLYFVMEYVKGETLQNHFFPEPYPEEVEEQSAFYKEISKPEYVERVLRAGLQVCDALSCIHAHRIIHRDLKPDNILINKKDKVKLLDFGIAKRLGAQENSQSHSIMGTFTYISPEQAQCTDVDGRSDLYTLGVILYELLTGRPPFVSAEPIGRLYMHLNKPAPPIHEFNPHIDRDLEAIVLKLLQKEPIARYQRAEDLKAILELYLSENSQMNPSQTGNFKQIESIVMDPMFVGRDEVLQEVSSFQSSPESKAVELLVLSGNTGMGKTRLARECLASFRAQQIECCTVRCHPESPPYAAFQELMEQLRVSLLWRSEKKPLELWGDSAQVWFELMDSASSRVDSNGNKFDTFTPSSGGAEEEKFLLFDAARQMIELFVEHEPLVFFLDDLMTADEMSLELLEYLVRSLAQAESDHGFFLLTAFRNEDVHTDHPLNQLLVRLNEQELYRLLDLKPLSRRMVDEMATSMLSGAPTEETLNILMVQSQGIPFFVEELIKAWSEEEALEWQGRNWSLSSSEYTQEESDPTRWRLPLTIRKRLTRRLKRLSPSASWMSEWMAVLGEETSFEVMLAFSEWPESDLLACLDELIQQQILVEDWGAGTERYRFTHPGIREAIYHSLEAEQKIHYHRTAAEALKKLPTHEGAYEGLALHFLAAGDEADSAWYFLLAAERQRSAYAHRSAWELLMRCREILKRNRGLLIFLPGSNEWWCYQLAVLELSDIFGTSQEGLEHAQQALKVLPHDADPTPLLCWSAVFYRQLGAHQDALACVQKALQYEQGEGAWRPYLLQEAGRIYRVQVKFSAALEAFQEALSWASSRDHLWLQGRISCMIGVVLHLRGAFMEARIYFEGALDISQSEDDRRGEIEALCHLGKLELDEGHLASAVKHIEQAMLRAQEIGERKFQGFVLFLRGIILEARGRFEESRTELETALEWARHGHNLLIESELLGYLGLVCIRLREYDLARSYLQQGYVSAKSVGNRLVELRIQALVCVIDVFEQKRSGRDALSELLEIIQQSEDMEIIELVLLCKWLLITVSRHLNAHEKAFDYIVSARYLALQIGHRRILAKLESELVLLECRKRDAQLLLPV